MRHPIFAPKAQQQEGLRWVLSRVGVPVFRRALRSLRAEGFSTKSKLHRTEHLARKAIGMSFEEWSRR